MLVFFKNSHGQIINHRKGVLEDRIRESVKFVQDRSLKVEDELLQNRYFKMNPTNKMKR